MFVAGQGYPPPLPLLFLKLLMSFVGEVEPDLMSDMPLPQQVQMRELMESPAYTSRITAMSRLFGRHLPGMYSPRYLCVDL